MTARVPISFWLTGVFFPQNLFAAFAQKFARDTKTPYELVKFNVNVLTQEPTGTPGTGLHIHGLYIENGQWDHSSQRLAESRKLELLTTMPHVWMQPHAEGTPTAGEQEVANKYDCPLYRNYTRRGMLSSLGHSSNFVMVLSLPCEKPGILTLSGVACLLAPPP